MTSTLADRDPRMWGTHYWYVLQCTAAAFPEKDATPELQHATQSFFESFREMLPCAKCRQHYIEHLKTHPVPVSEGRAKLMQWVAETRQTISSATRVVSAAPRVVPPPTLQRAKHHHQLQQQANAVRKRNVKSYRSGGCSSCGGGKK